MSTKETKKNIIQAGRIAIKELIKVAKNKGCYRITLFCKETLVNFYGRNGFEVNNVVMKKYL